MTKRKFQLTSLDGNNNKFYLVEISDLPGGLVHFKATFGRVGTRGQVWEKDISKRLAEKKIAEKLRKGYVEVELHEVQGESASPIAATDATAEHAAELIMAEAGESISSFLATTVDALSLEQIGKGRIILDMIGVGDKYKRSSLVEAFYNVIPTKLPRRIDKSRIVSEFKIDQAEERLDQLEAAISAMATQRDGTTVALATLSSVSVGDTIYERIARSIAETSVHKWKPKVHSVVSVSVDGERARFDGESTGKHNVTRLFHGTGAPNVYHILRDGLKCPRTRSNGRMFGHGIYFADMFSKAGGYCKSRVSPYKFAIIADVALGDSYLAKSAMQSIEKAPRGYQSVEGRRGYTKSKYWGGVLRHNEFIVYKPSQQTIRYLVLFERRDETRR